jgi:hypothetical protein
MNRPGSDCIGDLTAGLASTPFVLITTFNFQLPAFEERNNEEPGT